jgi:antitoxin component of MazEF toxin-antitoxin module
MGHQPIDFAKVTAGLSTKSEKIRALKRAGAATADIARFLEIRYQHARNVLADAGMLGAGQATHVGPFAAYEPTGGAAWIRVSGDGSIRLPAEILDGAGLAPGQHAHVSVRNGRIEVLSQVAALERARALVREYVPEGKSLVDDLIAERRRESQHDEGRR